MVNQYYYRSVGGPAIRSLRIFWKIYCEEAAFSYAGCVCGRVRLRRTLKLSSTRMRPHKDHGSTESRPPWL